MPRRKTSYCNHEQQGAQIIEEGSFKSTTILSENTISSRHSQVKLNRNISQVPPVDQRGRPIESIYKKLTSFKPKDSDSALSKCTLSARSKQVTEDAPATTIKVTSYN